MTINGLDQIDKELIALLQADDRVPVAEMGKRLGLPPSTLNDRIRRLVRTGTITGFHAHVDPEKLGLDLLAFVFVGWSDASTEADFLRCVAGAPQILECHHVTGGWNYMIKVRVTGRRELKAFLDSLAQEVSGLDRSETIIALSSAKETAMLDPATLH